MTDVKKAKGNFTKVPAVTRFHRLSQRPGGVTRKEAVRNADAAVEKLKSEYADWLNTDVMSLAATLDTLRNKETRNPEAVVEAYHKARAIRDLGSTFGFPAITTVANSFCELLHRFQSNEIYSQDAIDALMSSLLYVKVSEDTKELSTMLFPGLERVVNRFPPAKSDKSS